jgi:adenylosuccinate synthase
MSSIKYIDIVLDGRYGDSGKGKIVYDLLLKRGHQLCVKFNGGPNAGHTIYRLNNNKYEKIALHMLPIGMIKEDVYNLISSDCVIDIAKLKKELEYLKSLNINITNRLFISKSAHIITEESINKDKQTNIIGTTGSGIGPTYANKALRFGIRADDVRTELEAMGIHVVDMRHFWETPFVIDKIDSVIMEGSQGFELDINWCKNYPYCTSSTCTIAGAINTGIRISSIRDIIVSAKAYDTYVGTMEFQPSNDPDLEQIAKIGSEFGTTTGRKRQCNYLNLDDYKISVRINNGTTCIINKCDILDEVGVFRVYSNSKMIEFNNIDEMKKYIEKEIMEITGIRQVIFSSSKYSI